MKKYLILIFVALAAVFQSCDNNDDLWDAIDDLKSRVQALETQVDALNGNIEALQKLYGGATISKVENVGGIRRHADQWRDHRTGAGQRGRGRDSDRLD